MQQETPTTPPRANLRNKRKISPFWLLPIIALRIAAWLLWTNYQERGTIITINFQSADGIVPGRTPIPSLAATHMVGMYLGNYYLMTSRPDAGLPSL